MIKNFQKVISSFRKHYKEIPLEKVGQSPYNNLVATFLSPRTKDEVTLAAFQRLFKRAKNFKELSKLPESLIAKLIYPVAFYRVKARNLLNLARIINSQYEGRVPNTINQLLQLPGVGRKIANIVLAGSFNQNAIAVDTHVHRITNILGWVDTKTPEKTEEELIKIIPTKYWNDINRLFVSIGQQHRSKSSLFAFLQKEKLISKGK